MNKSLSLKKNFAWTFVGSISASACQWFMLIVMAKLLEKEQVGFYALALAIAAPVVMFSMLHLRAVQITDVHGQNAFGDYLGVRLFTNTLGGVVILGIAFSLIGRYGVYVFWIITAEGIIKLIEATSDIVYGAMQKHERMDKMAQSLILRNVGGLLFLSIAVFLTKSLLWGIFAIGLWWLLVLIFFDCRNAAKFERIVPRLEIRRALSIMWVALPLGIMMGFMTLNDSIPRFFIEAHLGADNLGIFAAMAYVVVGASRCVISLGQAVAARLAKYYAFDRKSYILLLTKVVLIALAMSVAAILFGVFFGQAFLRIVYNPEYAEQPDVFIWLLILAGTQMVTSMLGVGMTAARRFRSQIWVQAIAVGVCLIACWLLIPRYGLKGAAFSMLAAQISVAIVSLFVINMALKCPITDLPKDLSGDSK
jgi:O-antigen/teichoic acid export membrane protein